MPVHRNMGIAWAVFQPGGYIRKSYSARPYPASFQGNSPDDADKLSDPSGILISVIGGIWQTWTDFHGEFFV